jgi:hypothetical protein
MAVAATFEVDRKSLRELQSALRLYEKATKRDVPYICNRAAMNLAFRGFQFTKMADKATVVAGLKPSPKYPHPQARARAIVVSRFKARGEAVPKGGRVTRLANALLAGRIRAGFIRAGWLRAAKKLQKSVRGGRPMGITTKGISPRAGRGDATLARQSLLSFAAIMNQSVSKSKTSGQALVQYGSEGMRKAMRFVIDDLRTYATERLRKQAAKFNKR